MENTWCVSSLEGHGFTVKYCIYAHDDDDDDDDSYLRLEGIVLRHSEARKITKRFPRIIEGIRDPKPLS
jgi:hypothetical protein